MGLAILEDVVTVGFDVNVAGVVVDVLSDVTGGDIAGNGVAPWNCGSVIICSSSIDGSGGGRRCAGYAGDAVDKADDAAAPDIPSLPVNGVDGLDPIGDPACVVGRRGKPTRR